MATQSKKNTVFSVLICCICVGIAAVFLLTGSGAPRVSPVRVTDCTELLDFRLDLRETDAYAGVEKHYSALLPEVRSGKENLFVYFVHAYAEVTLDGERAAFTAEDRGLRLGHTPGCYWLIVPLTEADSGKELEIVSAPIYPAVENRNPRVLIGRWNAVLAALACESLGELIMSVVCVVAGLLVLLFAPLLRSSRQEQLQMLYLGLFTLSVGLWRLCDRQITSMVFPRYTVVLYDLALLSAILCPMFFCRFLYWQNRGDREAVYNWLSLLLAAEILVVILLQLLNVVDMRAILDMLLAVVPAAGTVIAVHSVRNLLRGPVSREHAVYDCMYLAFVLAGLTDLAHYLLEGSSRFLPAFLSITVLHLVVMGASILHQAAERQKRAGELEAELAKEHARLMLSQIQPHFLYNSLSVIRELCHRDPEQAEKATVMFADYLRKNMDSLLVETPVPFEEELRHTRNYVELEQLRFRSRLRVEYDVPVRDFLLPSLTLQPIVENAVRYTMRARAEGAEVVIRTRKTDRTVQILIQDNGPGFDPEAVSGDGRSHVGIRNVRNRLSQICGGRLRLESAPGEGTTAVIEIPVRPDGWAVTDGLAPATKRKGV